jgi:hypothetical protein
MSGVGSHLHYVVDHAAERPATAALLRIEDYMLAAGRINLLGQPRQRRRQVQVYA